LLPASVYSESALCYDSSVLIVNDSADAREVLRVALSRRGARILEAADAGQAEELARQERPDVIVFDIEGAAMHWPINWIESPRSGSRPWSCWPPPVARRGACLTASSSPNPIGMAR